MKTNRKNNEIYKKNHKKKEKKVKSLVSLSDLFIPYENDKNKRRVNNLVNSIKNKKTLARQFIYFRLQKKNNKEKKDAFPIKDKIKYMKQSKILNIKNNKRIHVPKVFTNNMAITKIISFSYLTI